MGDDDIPAEKYFVAWDGVTAFVLWEQPNDSFPAAGGHVVTDILSSVLASTQAELYVQACRPECDNIFFHTDLHVYATDNETPGQSPLVRPRPDGNGADISVPRGPDNFDVLTWLHIYLGLAAYRFGKLKNMGRRILDIESSIRDQMAHLLGHYYDHARIAARPLWRSFKDRWRTRRWRRAARQILAGLWLSLANVEGLRREWEDSRREFEGRRNEYMALFLVDYSDDVATIESLEVSHLDATIEQISGNLDNRAVVMATVGGALAGGRSWRDRGPDPLSICPGLLSSSS